jgi:hypothetical protein
MYPASIVLTRSLYRSSTRSQSLQLRSKSTKAASFMNTAAETISSLRWRIATSLTESLSPQEQQELLARLKVAEPTPTTTQQPEEEPHVQKSIAEAVAQARAEEAKAQSAQWEREKDRLKAEFEEAARKRVETELAIQHRKLAFEKWQQEVQAANQNNNNNYNSTNVVKATVVTSEEDHPVLGKPILDLGYKR